MTNIFRGAGTYAPAFGDIARRWQDDTCRRILARAAVPTDGELPSGEYCFWSYIVWDTARTPHVGLRTLDGVRAHIEANPASKSVAATVCCKITGIKNSINITEHMDVSKWLATHTDMYAHDQAAFPNPALAVWSAYFVDTDALRRHVLRLCRNGGMQG